MKPSAIRPFRSASAAGKRMPAPAALAVLFAMLALAAPLAQAATRYWDGGSVDITANGDGASQGVSGTWNTTLMNWDQGSGLPHVAWVNGSDTAEINGGSQSLTLGANIILGGITQKAGANGAAISGGSGPFTLTLNTTGANTFLAAANSTTGRTLTVNAVIAGGVGKNLVLAGPSTSGVGTINLGSANTFSGSTSFSAGATGGVHVILKHQLAFQNTAVTLSPDVNLIFDSSVSANAFTFGGLDADSNGPGYDLALQNNSGATPITLTLGGNNYDSSYAGVLSGGGSLIKTGSGTLILAGANTYTGSTVINGGTLQVDGILASPITVSNGVTLAGGGLVNAAVTVAAGGSVTAGDGTGGDLAVSSLTFNGTGTVNVGTLSGYTSTAAIMVSNALTLSGGAASVTVNLPTDPGFNGTYHLIQFGSGIANTSGFTLGTVPALTSNQTAALRVNGNFLDYVISAVGDTTPPVLVSLLPANNASNVLTDANLVATFNETVVAGSGNIELHKSDGTLVESYNVASSPQLTFSTAQLIISPTSVLASNQQYYVLIPFGAVTDTSGNSFAGITTSTGWRFTVPVPVVLYTDTGSPTNPPWSQVYNTISSAGYIGKNYPGPVYGSAINVNNPAVEVGLYGNRPISVPSQHIHVACNTAATNFANFTRWFQTDGNTQVLRVFQNDQNVATARPGVSEHNETFSGAGWNYTDNTTHEWTGHYTEAHILQGFAAFQLKNSDNDWAFQLSMGSDGTIKINNRYGTDVTVTNPDGSAKNFSGGGFDMRVLDDGLHYKVWIDGVLYGTGSYPRPTGTTVFRWGMYFGANNLHPPSDYNLLLVSGAQVQSWPGTLNSAITSVVKGNNTTNLDNGASWVGGAVPGLYNLAVWDSTVTAANTITLANSQEWSGVQILNPGGPVTINGTNLLILDASGVDLAAATQDLTVNAPMQMTVASPWAVAPGRTATFNGIISGFPGPTVNGGGTVQLNAANTYSGDTTVSSGTLVVNANSALGTGLLILNGGNLSNTASCALGNGVNLSSNATVSVGASQTLTLNGSLAGTGSLTKSGTGTLTLSGANTCTGVTIVSAGTLALGNPSALLSTTSLSLAAGTQLQPTVDGVIIKAPVTVGNSGTTATISAPVNSPGTGVVSTLTLNGSISGGGNVAFSSSVNQNALSTVYLGAQSTYAGGTLLDTAGTSDTQLIVKLGTNDALPTNTVLTIDGQTGAGTGRFAELNLNGFDQQLTGLTNTVRNLRIQRIVNSDISAAATLTINNSSDFSFSGILGGSASGSVAAVAMPGSTNGNNFGLTKSGAGTFILTGPNTYTGATTVNGGTLKLGANNVLANATAVFIGNATLNAATYTCTLGTLDVTGRATINLGAGAALAFADSSVIDWTGGTLNLTGTFVPGASLRFGTNSSGLTAAQLARITAPGFCSFALNASGYLTASAATTFSTWINGTFTGGSTVPPDKRGINDDPSNDGISNLVKYAVAGQDPMLPNTSVGVLSANTLRFTKRPGTSGLTYAIQGSTDLGVTDPWAEVSGASYVNNANTISYTFTPGTPAKYFLRLLILQN